MDGSFTAYSGCRAPDSALSVSEDTQGDPLADAKFDQWLAHHLKRLYDPVANESIPADLIRLLESRLK